MPDVVDLLELSDDEFEALADRDVRGRADAALQAALRHPDVVDRFYGHLVGINAAIERNLEYRLSQCEAATAEVKRLEADGADELPAAVAREQSLWRAYDQWYPITIRYRGKLEQAIERVRPLRDRLSSTNLAPEVERLRARVNELESAIRDHRSSVLPEECTTADKTLWLLVA